MKNVLMLLPLLGCLLLGHTYAHQVLNELLEQQRKDLDLSTTEVEALRPFYQELQAQHNYLYGLSLQKGDGSVPMPTQAQLDDAYVKVFEEFRAEFKTYLNYRPSIEYDTKLPTLRQIVAESNDSKTEQELMELDDLLDILQDVIDESQLGIDQLVARATDMEINLLKLNKPKIIMAVIGALETMWHTWGRFSQAAYCGYSHIPQFTVALRAIHGGVDCYAYTKDLILRIENETIASVKEIKLNVQKLVKIYHKITAKKSLLGKILTGTLNLLSALRRVHDIIAVGIAGYDKINNQLPGAAMQSAQCAATFVDSIPQMVETAKNLTACITFVNNEKEDYDFLKPEAERYWNTGEQPGSIPQESDEEKDDGDPATDDDDEDDDDEDDDYVDHR